MNSSSADQHLRRDFLTTAASGLGGLALSSLLNGDAAAATSAVAPQPTHFPPRAKACIFIYMAGGPSHVDLFDPKPILNNRDGAKCPTRC